ncbi:hypothetical protein MHK_006323 [Candidatus Magnetomorum sp. HK-1]|nr:hypothetical protein MHK_006323 [Candidatus Magnetomorum sp. HK-1]
MIEFKIISNIKNVEIIASGHSVHIKNYLDKVYGKGKWRKMKGFATVEFDSGQINNAEIHWFEAHGIGKKDFKIKRVIK